MEGIIEKIRKYSDVFHLPGEELSSTHVFLICYFNNFNTSYVLYPISLQDGSAIVNEKQYRFPAAHREEVDKTIKELFEGRVIVPSESPHNSPVWVDPKKAGNQGKKISDGTRIWKTERKYETGHIPDTK